MPRRLIAASLLALSFGSAELAAQDRRADEEVRLAREAVIRGDTTDALARIERALQLNPRLADAHFQLGQIYAERAGGSATDFEDRAKANQALQEALRYDPHNPVYLLELGKLMLKQQIRLDARRMFKRALDEAARADAATFAEVHFQLGLMREVQWLRFRNRHLVLGRDGVDANRALQDPRYVWRLLNASFAPPDQGLDERDAMLAHYRTALAAYPGHVGAATHLLAYLYDEGLFEEYQDVAGQFVRSASSEPLAYLAVGLGHYRTGESDEAMGAFQFALTLMRPEERRLFEDVTRILDREAEERIAALSTASRELYQERFWSLADPLFLTTSNEYWLEYIARLTYADLRFGIPEYGVRGWDTDRGLIYVRYGAPLRQATFAPEMMGSGPPDAAGKVTTVWSYGEDGPVFVFRQNPGYRRAIFADDFAFHASSLRAVQPAVLTSHHLPELEPIPVQAARFRGEAGTMAVEVHALLPLRKLGQGAPLDTGDIELGVFVQDKTSGELVRRTRKERLALAIARDQSLESWRIPIPDSGLHLIAVEAREPLTWHAAVGRVLLEPRRFPAGELALSDLLMAFSVEPGTTEPLARGDFRVVPNPALSYVAGQPVAVYAELYNLLPDADHFASYEVELVVTVKEIHRAGPQLRRALGELADRWGLTPEGTDPVHLRFTREARVAARDLVPEFFRVDLADAPPGRYGIRLTVRDRNAGREASSEREFSVRPTS